MRNKLFPIILTAALTSVSTYFIAARFSDKLPFATIEQRLPVNYAGFNTADMIKSAPPADFESAAQASVQAVVHIKTSTKGRTVTAQDPLFNDEYFGNIFGRRQYYIPPQLGSGSGVVVSPDGYIVTNNHVVANAEDVTVTFNDRYTTTAEIVSKDPSTDIALLKVKDKDLPYMEFGNSDHVKLGQWVLAVGYPLTLDATVTAGIVSAKSRAIGVNKTQSANAIESFIQTDAAVNPGNSGGALVNTNGQLIGMNSAIASPTGSYAGYSYAIPSNIVKKVVNDLMKYGSVQRGYLGIELQDPASLTTEQMRELGIDKADGVYVAGVRENTGALRAGLKKGDFITQINGVPVHSQPQLLEQVALYKPGDNVSLSYVRNGKTYNTTVELKKFTGPTMFLGASMRPLTAAEKAQYQLSSGVLVTEIREGLISKQTNMRKGFVILTINNSAVNTADDVQKILANSSNAQIAGFYPGNNGIYYYGLKLDGSTQEEQ
jgi:serine protease Do